MQNENRIDRGPFKNWTEGACLGFLFVVLIGLAIACLSACAVDAGGPEDVEATVQPVTGCWNVTRVTTTPGWPPLDMFVSAAAMQSWQGGSWQPCTNNAADTKVVCKRFVDTNPRPQVVAYWNYCIPTGGPDCLMTIFYDPDNTETTHLHGMQIWTSDWDDDVYWHGTISPVSDSSFSSGSVTVTHLSGNSWQVHTCIQ